MESERRASISGEDLESEWKYRASVEYAPGFQDLVPKV